MIRGVHSHRFQHPHQHTQHTVPTLTIGEPKKNFPTCMYMILVCFQEIVITKMYVRLFPQSRRYVAIMNMTCMCMAIVIMTCMCMAIVIMTCMCMAIVIMTCMCMAIVIMTCMCMAIVIMTCMCMAQMRYDTRASIRLIASAITLSVGVIMPRLTAHAQRYCRGN